MNGLIDGGLRDFRRYTWWTVPGTAAIVLLLFLGGWLLRDRMPDSIRVIGTMALVVTVAAAVVLLCRRLAPVPDAVTAHPTAWLLAGGAGAVVLGAAALAVREYGRWAVAPAMLVAIAATLRSPRQRRVLLAGATLAAAIPGTVVSLLDGDDRVLYAAAFPPGLVLFTAWVTLAPLWAWDVTRTLNEARGLAAELAVKDERLRFASDLHDIQGHHLQVIALKSELAARLVELDPARATAEMREVQRLSTDALQETRALVQGYRRTTLEAEIANATRVLAAAGIDARMDVQPTVDRLPEAGRHLLGLVMREATTNVLRHSEAAHADVEYRVDGDGARLSVSNDGAAGHSASGGTGLASLAERLAAAGGELTWRLDGERFAVRATLPAAREAR